MDPDATLEWILRLRAALDASLEGTPRRIDRDALYTLVGLIDELDAWLCSGRAAPSRWRAAFRAADADPRGVLSGPDARALVLDTAHGPSNDAWPGRRRALARRHRAAQHAKAQLVLPFALAP